MDNAKSALRNGRTLPSERVTVAYYAASWLSMKRTAVRYKTYEGWEGQLRLHVIPYIGRVQIARLTPLHLQQLYVDLDENGLSSTSVNSVHRTLKNMLRTADRMDVAPRCIADLVHGPSIKRREMLILSERQARSLLQECKDDRLGTLFELALMSGARISELLALRWQDVELDRQELHIRLALQRTEKGSKPGEPKTRAGARSVPLDVPMVESLKRHRAAMAGEALKLGQMWQNSQGLVFVTSVGTQLSAANILRRQFRPLVKAAGLPEKLRLHDLRHFWASYNLNRGMPVATVSKIMGHSSPAVTLSIYAHCVPGDERNIADNMSTLRVG